MFKFDIWSPRANISCLHFFCFFYLSSKWRVVRIRKKLKIFCFLKNRFNDFHKMLWIYSSAFFVFLFRPTIKIKGSLLKKQANELNDKHVQYCFSCYVIKSAEEAANKVLLSVVWNPLLIEINLSQIRALDIKREKVCAVCPYLLFLKHIFRQWDWCGTKNHIRDMPNYFFYVAVIYLNTINLSHK